MFSTFIFFSMRVPSLLTAIPVLLGTACGNLNEEELDAVRKQLNQGCSVLLDTGLPVQPVQAQGVDATLTQWMVRDANESCICTHDLTFNGITCRWVKLGHDAILISFKENAPEKEDGTKGEINVAYYEVIQGGESRSGFVTDLLVKEADETPLSDAERAQLELYRSVKDQVTGLYDRMSSGVANSVQTASTR